MTAGRKRRLEVDVLVKGVGVGRVDANLFVVLLEGGEVLAGPGNRAASTQLGQQGCLEGITRERKVWTYSENSPSSIPSPTYQWTKARFE